MNETPAERDDGKADVTRLLRRLEAGDPEAADELFHELYPDLRQHAEAQMRKQAACHTLQATALVHEAFLRLTKLGEPSFADRRHFLLTASRAMRHVLIDHARSKQRLKREGGRGRESLEGLTFSTGEEQFDLEELDAALAELEGRDPQMARAVELRFFGGLEVAETAAILNIAPRTFDRRWKAARQWLRERLEP